MRDRPLRHDFGTAVRVLTVIVMIAPYVSSVVAGEGRIPIWEPTTITQSGRYIVTRNIGDVPTSTPPRAITIATSNVDIDLNGFTLRLGEPVIYAENVQEITIHDGKIVSYEDAIQLVNVERFAIRGVQVQSPEDPAIIVSGSNGVLESNQIDNSISAISVSGAGIDIRRNEIRGGFWGIYLQECTGCAVRENTLSSGSGVTVDAASTGNLVIGNVISGAQIFVEGQRNQVVENLVTGYFGFGLEFSQSSADNVYGANTARGNGGAGCTSPPDFCDQGTGNTSHGDNYLPGLQ